MQSKQTSIKPPLILTLDIGTSSTRAIMFDSQARPVEGCLAQLPYQLRTTPDGGAEFEANELFESVVGTIDRVLQLAGPLADQIGGVAIDTLVATIMGIDAAGQPVTPVFTYADTRSAADTQRLREEFGQQNLDLIHNRTGCLLPGPQHLSTGSISLVSPHSTGLAEILCSLGFHRRVSFLAFLWSVSG
jgi:gluconokinase